jgi:hypothetical protein
MSKHLGFSDGCPDIGIYSGITKLTQCRVQFCHSVVSLWPDIGIYPISGIPRPGDPTRIKIGYKPAAARQYGLGYRPGRGHTRYRDSEQYSSRTRYTVGLRVGALIFRVRIKLITTSSTVTVTVTEFHHGHPRACPPVDPAQAQSGPRILGSAGRRARAPAASGSDSEAAYYY